MKKLKSTIFLTMLLMTVNTMLAQLSPSEVTDVQSLLTTNPSLVTESIEDIVCEPTDNIYNLQCPRYQNLVTGIDYTTAINQAITDANVNGGGVILFPGNTIVEISTQLTVYSNITLRASHAMATIRCSSAFTGNQMIVLVDRENVAFENMRFNANEKASGIVSFGTTNRDIDIVNCVFEKTNRPDTFGAGVALQNSADVTVKNCVFRRSNFGVSFSRRNSRIRIEDNRFEKSLTNNPIRISGRAFHQEFSDNVWIRGNDIHVQRAPSIIDEHESLTRDPNTGAVSGLSHINGNPEMPATDTTPYVPADPNYNEQYYTWRWERKGASAIYVTAGNTGNESGGSVHENIVIENNIAVGADYGFFDGGSADLYSLKDIVRLKCVNNVARNSGDLGFAIERCVGAIVSGNTADRNNSFGIGISESRNSVVSGNILENNALRRDFLYNSSPYGGIVIVGRSFNNLIEGNHFFTYSKYDVSFPITDDYTRRESPTDYYGIVIRATYDDTGGASTTESPFANKIGNNHYAGQKWGTIYSQVADTQLNDEFSGTTFPKNQDYPLGTWFRNANMNTAALGWSVINRVETELHSDWAISDTYIEIKDPTNSIQKDDIFGVMLDDGNVHWSVIDELIPESGYYKVRLLQAPPSELTGAGIIDPAASRTQTAGYGMDRIVVLRWLTVTK